METKQKNRTAAPQGRSRSAEKDIKQRRPAQPPKQRKAAQSAKNARPAQNRTRSAAAPNPQRSKEADRQREELRQRKAAQDQRAARERAQKIAEAEQNIPEAVFNTAQQGSGRTAEDNKRSQMRRSSAKRVQERKKLELIKKNRPAVAYTQPKPFNLNKLLLELAVVVAVVVAIVLGLSVFFKVEHVVVYGNHAYSAWTVQEASGIEGGENLLTFGRPRACGKIITALPYVEDVRIGIKLPDTVNIYITEHDVAYAISTDDGTWWLMTSDGKMVEQIDSGTAQNYTKVLGVELNGPTVGSKAVAMEEFMPEEETTSQSSTEVTSPVPTVTGADRLRAALQILTSLENNEIVGEAASVNVSNLKNIELMYGQRYQVKLGDSSQMDKKIYQMKNAISQFNDYQTGILDVSYTTWPDGPFFTPYE